MKILYSSFFCLVITLVLSAITAGAETVEYNFENVMTSGGQPMYGTFTWTYDVNDFENGVGDFTFLDIPWTTHNHTDLDWTIDVGSSIEIVLDGSVHDDGVDITLFLDQPLTPTTSAPVDLVRSKYEIGGNGFHDGTFVSGQITPDLTPPCNPGDTDGDGDIDTLDLTTSITNFTGAGGTGGSCATGDTDDDGDVDTADLTFSITNFTGAQAYNSNIPDLWYDPTTGNVTIDADGADMISFSLQGGPFGSVDFSELPLGLTDNLPGHIGWTSFNLYSGLTGSADLGAILPPDLGCAELDAVLSTASYGLALAGGGGGGRFDILHPACCPEPASITIVILVAAALLRRCNA